MPSLSEVWPVIKEILEVGGVGAVAVLMVYVWIRVSKDLKESQEKRIAEQKEHSKELLRLATEHSKELTNVVRQYDEALTSVDMTLEKLSGALEE